MALCLQWRQMAKLCNLGNYNAEAQYCTVTTVIRVTWWLASNKRDRQLNSTTQANNKWALCSLGNIQFIKIYKNLFGKNMRWAKNKNTPQCSRKKKRLFINLYITLLFVHSLWQSNNLRQKMITFQSGLILAILLSAWKCEIFANDLHIWWIMYLLDFTKSLLSRVMGRQRIAIFNS